MDTPEKPNDAAQSAGLPNTGAANPASRPDPVRHITGLFQQKSKPVVTPASSPQGFTGLHIATMILTVLIFGMLCYSFYEQRQDKKALEADIQRSEEALGLATKRIAASEAKITELNSDLDTVRKRAGVTQKELDAARDLARRLKQEQEASLKQLNSEIARKADTQQLSELRQEAENKLGVVSTDVTSVKGDVTTVKGEIATTRQDLQNTRRELLDVHEQLRSQVAKNYAELSELRRKGERDYYEFDIVKKNSFQRVGDINLALRKADAKKKRYDIKVTVDDNTLEKRDRVVNEPVQFLVGKDRLRYEIVVFNVAKDRITGYLSTPKDRKLSAERAQ